jgi:hypothetical protein
MSPLMTNRLILFGEISCVYSRNQIEHVYNPRVYAQNAKIFNVKPNGTYSYHCALKG